MAQVITACQMVYEEKFVTKHNVPPLQAVGWEGKLPNLFSIYMLFSVIKVSCYLSIIDFYRGNANLNHSISRACLGHILYLQ